MTSRAALLSSFLLFALLPEALAQTAVVRGFITDASDGETLQGVNVFVETPEGQLVMGAVTDSDGFYILSAIPPGAYQFRASFIGYASVREAITLEAGQVITRNLAMAQEQTELDEVVIEAEREAGAAAVTAGLQTIRARDLERIPSPDLSSDLVGYLQALPGVVSSGDRGGQLFIRGGTPTQNLVLIDGMQVYQPFHIIGFYSAFPADIISKVDVYAGGFPARFGGRLSSVIDISTINGNNRRFQGALSVAPFLATARLEGPLWPGRASFLASVRESAIEVAGPRLLGQELPYRFGDRFAKINAVLTPSTRLSLTGLHTTDRGYLDPRDEDRAATRDEQVRWGNQALGFRFLFLPPELPMFAEITFSYGRLESEFGQVDDPERFSSVREYDVGANLSYYRPSTDVNFGIFLRSAALRYDLGGLFRGLTDNNEYVTEAGGYIEVAYRPIATAEITPGLRLQAFPSLSRFAAEPRLRARWRVGGIHQLSAAWGIYHQEIVGLNDRRDAGDVFTAWAASPFAQAIPQATHYIAGYRVQPFGFLELGVEGYYKTFSNLAIPVWSAVPAFQTDLQTAEGTARGVDLRLELNGDALYSFLSYSYGQVEYDAQQEALELWYGTQEVRFSPPHDRRHQASVLLGATLLDVDLSARWQFGSGQPYSQSIGFDTFVLLDSAEVDVTTEPGTPRVIYGPPYGGRLPVYHRFDMSAERAFQLSPRVALTAQASLINVYDRTNLLYLDIFTLRRVDQLPLIPSFGLKLSIE